MADSVTPTVPPPAAAEAAGTGESKPTLTAPAAIATNGASVVAAGKPSLQPGDDAVAVAAAGGITGTWTTGVTINSLWSINEVRNAWMGVASVGWKKLYNGGDGAFTALTTLASQARQTGRPVNFRQETDGMVHEIYLW